MPTLLGEYCIRCGSLCTQTPSADGTEINYVCPRGCGVQGIVPAPSQVGKAETEPPPSKQSAENAKKHESLIQRAESVFTHEKKPRGEQQ